MSKTKFSFSLILTIILVGILSTSVFARGAFWAGLSADKDTNGNYTGSYTFSFINTSDDGTKDFAVKVFSGVNYSNLEYTSPTIENAPSVPEPNNSTPTNKIVIGKDNVAFVDGTIYKFVLYDVTDPAKEIATEIKYGVITTHDNKNLASVASNPDGLLDVVGSGITNANHTGQTDNKGKGGNKHGFYQNNTNSCAACHQTHTAAESSSLLFKDGVYSTCSACHDGTTGAYNAFATPNAETPNEIAGTFNVKQDSTHNGSLHQADGSVDVKAAPGGGMKSTSAMWGNEFNCASCHAPHGSGSSVENNLNMDVLGWGTVKYQSLPVGVTLANATDAQKDALNGKLYVDQTINTSVPTTYSAPYVLVRTTAAAADVAADATNPMKDYKGYYARAGVKAGDLVLQTYRWTGSKYERDFSVWLRDPNGYGSVKADTVFKDANDAPLTLANVVWLDGFAFGTDVANVAKATFSLGIDVETTHDIATLFDSNNAKYVFGSGMEMGKYCGACHTDYLAKRSEKSKNLTADGQGTYTQAHRHTTNNDRLTCVRCHFGHGSDAQIMKDANDETYFTKVADGVAPATALDYLKDVNPSSALKRYTGMAVCYACHGDGAQFINNVNNDRLDVKTNGSHTGIKADGTVADDGEDPLLSGDPGTERGK
jgi:hypothetical protein